MKTACLLAAVLPVVSSYQLAPAACRHAPAHAATAQFSPRTAIVRMEDEDPDPDAVIKDAVDKFKKTIASTQESLMTLRVGRANPGLLDRVEVNYYDTPTPLNQLASVTAVKKSAHQRCVKGVCLAPPRWLRRAL